MLSNRHNLFGYGIRTRNPQYCLIVTTFSVKESAIVIRNIASLVPPLQIAHTNSDTQYCLNYYNSFSYSSIFHLWFHPYGQLTPIQIHAILPNSFSYSAILLLFNTNKSNLFLTLLNNKKIVNLQNFAKEYFI